MPSTSIVMLIVAVLILLCMAVWVRVEANRPPPSLVSSDCVKKEIDRKSRVLNTQLFFICLAACIALASLFLPK
jgi:hypothetical protein